MLIQIHILQNYAPANLNRDDTGSPKDAFFGGVRRGRISSQCLKRSIRRSEAFAQAFSAEGLLGVRTKTLPDLIARELEAMGADEEERRQILSRVAEIGRESKKKNTEQVEADGDEGAAENEPLAASEAATKQLIFIGRDELRPLAEKLYKLYQEQGSKNWSKMKIPDITKALGSSLPRSVDIAMFGRMTTSSAFEDVQAAVQVAHALSTNVLAQEFDYYTAVDDLTQESGAGMIGDVEFNSSTYYKYLNVHWEELVKNLGGDRQVAMRAVLALIEAAATAHPSGKQNSFASFCLPDFVLVEISSRNLPVSYANAFVQPARANGGRSLMDASVEKLCEYVAQVTTAYNLDARRACLDLSLVNFLPAERQDSLRALLDWVQGQLPG